MTDKISLAEATVEQLLQELQRRPGVVASVWGVEDALGAIGEDEATADMSDAQLEEVATAYLSHVDEGLRDILADRGNTYLSDRWDSLRDEVLAEVAPTPAP